MHSISVVIPSFNRGLVLLDTIALLQQQELRADEIIIVDQTDYQENEIEFLKLDALNHDSEITWLRLPKPSIPNAMNVGLLHAKSDYVLFLDDDVLFSHDLIKLHYLVFERHQSIAQVGQVLQPNQKPQLKENVNTSQSKVGLNKDLDFSFASSNAAKVYNCMAGNLFVDRLKVIEAGGFDENFVGVAYRFETEFCRRMIRHYGQPFYFTPEPVLHHLQCETGGTRSQDHFLVSSSPRHSVGDYYYALLEGTKSEALIYCLKRFLLSVKARHYVRKPWYMPVRLLAEVRGFLLARKLLKKGPKNCSFNQSSVL